MISISGLASQTALRLIDVTRDKQIDLMRDNPVNKRGEAAFRDRIANITSPEEFVADFEVYSFVMKTFDLEDQIFGKGMVRKILESDPVSETSLLNRLTDSRFREMHLSLEFTTESGPQTPDFSNEEWVDRIVDRFYNRQFINENDNQNDTVGTVLELRDSFEGVTSWFNVLADKKLTKFFQVALNLPEQISGLDLDVQKKLFEEKFDLADLQDPKERERLITRFTAISDVLDPPQFIANSPAVSILQSASFGAQFVPITLDVAMVTFSASQLYR
jgi:Protein of unknown function (DUF1217)